MICGIVSDQLLAGCAFPLDGDAALTSYFSGTTTLSGAGTNNQTVTWVSTGSANSAVAGAASSASSGSIQMGASEIWIECETDGTAYNAYFGIIKTDGAGSFLGGVTNIATVGTVSVPVVMTLGLAPDGTITKKRDGATISTDAGGPVTGEYFTPYILFNNTNTTNTVTATLRTDASDMQYEGSGVTICGGAL